MYIASTATVSSELVISGITMVCFRFRPCFLDGLLVSSAAKFSEPIAEVEWGSKSLGIHFDFSVELSFTPAVSE